MTTLDARVPAAPPAPTAVWLAPALYASTLFGSALLLFAIQPMFAKLVLPRLGGAPAVWSVAMVFFQAALLLGYGYAHLLGRLQPGHAALVHLIALAAAAVTLPIGIVAGFEAPPESGIAVWLIGLFAASIGLPFVVLSASAPLLQHWFAASGDPQAGNPCALRCFQPRFFRGPARLSIRHRAAAAAAHPGARMVDRVRGARDADRSRRDDGGAPPRRR